MAILGKQNIIDSLRAAKLVYWRLFENQVKKTAGSFVATADFEKTNLGEEESYNELRSTLNRLTQGKYVLLAYKRPETKGGSAFDSEIEIEGTGGFSSAISGPGAAEFVMEGIGKITPENFEQAIETKMSMLLKKQQEEKDLSDLKAEVVRLKKEADENETGFKRGLLSIGAVLYPVVSKSPAFKEVIGMVSGIVKQIPQEGNTERLGSTAAPAAALPENHIEGDNMEIGGTMVNQEDMLNTLDDLGKDNPDVLQHLQILANLKKNNPAMYNEAVEMAKTL